MTSFYLYLQIIRISDHQYLDNVRGVFRNWEYNRGQKEKVL